MEIDKGPQSKKLLLSAVQQLSAKIEEMEAARKKADAEQPVSTFSWTDEQEQLYQEIARAMEEEPNRSCPHCGRGLYKHPDETPSLAAKAEFGAETSGQRLKFAHATDACSIWGSPK